jgi:hypothetical protein
MPPGTRSRPAENDVMATIRYCGSAALLTKAHPRNCTLIAAFRPAPREGQPAVRPSYFHRHADPLVIRVRTLQIGGLMDLEGAGDNAALHRLVGEDPVDGAALAAVCGKGLGRREVLC